MTVYKNSLVTTVFLDQSEPFVDYPCQVKIDLAEIVVSYKEENTCVLYKGKNKGTGHFKLISEQNNGKATLHKFEDENILEGYWIESGYEGFWKIILIN